MNRRKLILIVFIVDFIIVVGALLYFLAPNGNKTEVTEQGPGKPEVVTDESLKVDKPKVKLAVVVVFDQMRGDYVDKWRPLFVDNGFKRLQNDGAWFTDCRYPYATTSTGPGHASILSGTSPNKHGIINNDWFDMATRKKVYCAGTDRYTTVPPLQSKTKEPYSGTPDRMLSETVGDVLKKATAGKGKVFGLSLKDRSAILPVGKHPDGAYWFRNVFVTSTYYRDGLPAWVKAFNEEKLADSWFGKDWTYFRPDLDYTAYAGPDEGLNENKGYGQGITFPHPTVGINNKIDAEYYKAVDNSPYGNDMLLALTKRCIVEEQLGQDDTPDLLCVSFSSNDLVGHAFGPDSHEVLDITLRSDALMQDLMKFLDAKVGPGNYSLVVTADHGICPIPEQSAAKGLDAKRLGQGALLPGGEDALQTKFGKLDGNFANSANAQKTTWIETISAPWLYLNDRLIQSRGLNKEDVAREYANWAKTQPGIVAAYTAGQLQGDTLDDMGKMVKKSYYPGRSGDICLVNAPYWLVGDKGYGGGTSHGTPHDYDRHVAFLVYGPGIPGGERKEGVTPQHAAAITSYFLGIKPPKDCEVTLPKSLFEE